MSTRGQCFSPPQEHKPAPPQSTGSSGGRCTQAGSRGLLAATLLPDVGKIISLSAPRRSLPAQPPVIRGERCPWAAPSQSLGLSKVTQRRNIPCITQLSLLDEVTRASGLCTAGERCQRCRN